MPVAFSGQKLRQLRTAKRMTRRQLAAATGTNWRYVQHVELGQRGNPKYAFAHALAKTLGVTMEAFAVPDPGRAATPAALQAAA